MIRSLVVLFVFFSVLAGFAYPAAMTVMAAVLFPAQARGSLVFRDGRPVGSELIGQPFADPSYFSGRPSATARVPYEGRASAATNLGPSNPALTAAVAARVALLRRDAPGDAGPVPADLATASGSGLDPHLSPAGALWQVERVASARGLPVDTVRTLVLEHVEEPFLGVFGAPRVNVLALNLSLDALSGRGVHSTEARRGGADP